MDIFLLLVFEVVDLLLHALELYSVALVGLDQGLVGDYQCVVVAVHLVELAGDQPVVDALALADLADPVQFRLESRVG